MSDPKLPVGTKYCKCAACGEYFTTPANFDMHRRGEPTARFCADPASILTKTGKARLTLNAKGYWSRRQTTARNRVFIPAKPKEV